MAFTDDAVLAKLSALNETQESIVTVAQWVLFHKRHAERTAQLWNQRLKDSGANKRLNLMYLANEVVQQSKARRKDDFLIAFSPVIAEASATAYRGATNEVQQKLRRVIEVWRQRQIFDLPIQVAIETRIEELDKSRSGKKSLLGGSFLGSAASANAAPPELLPIVPLQTAVSKVSNQKATSTAHATTEYDKMTSPDNPTPTPPVHAARLSGLLKSLATAEGAVAESIKARRILIQGLEKILDNNRTSLKAEEAQVATLTERKEEIEGKKREVEDGIMRGLAAADESHSTPRDNDSGAPLTDPSATGRESAGRESADPERPPVEDLSSPSVEALTPEPSPPAALLSTEADHAPQPEYASSATPPVLPPIPSTSAPGSDFLSSLALIQGMPGLGSGATNGTATGQGSAKKRKLNDTAIDGVADGEEGAMEGLDDDVVGMLRGGV